MLTHGQDPARCRHIRRAGIDLQVRVPENLAAAVPEILAGFRNGGPREPLFAHLVRNCCLGRHLGCLELHRG